MAARAAGDSRYSTVAEESVIAPPKPCMVWYVTVGSTTMVGAVGVALPNMAGASGVSLSVPSGVVTQTRAWIPAEACAAAAGTAIAAVITVPSKTARSLIRAIPVIPSCDKMKQIRNFAMPGSEPADPATCQGLPSFAVIREACPRGMSAGRTGR